MKKKPPIKKAKSAACKTRAAKKSGHKRKKAAKEKRGCCATCEFWDHRTEAGMDECTGFCMIKRKIVPSRYWCRDFSEKGQEGAPVGFIDEETGEEDDEMEDLMDYE